MEYSGYGMQFKKPLDIKKHNLANTNQKTAPCELNTRAS